MKVLIRKLRPNVPTPAYQTPGAAGFDLHAAVDKTVMLAPKERALVPTGLAFAIPRGFEGQVRPRSGLALTLGVGIVNTPGTIDADYRGEVGVNLINLGHENVMIEPGDRIAQMIIAPIVQVDLEEVESLDDTSRGAGGYGSTGV
jgi:dUTP pyrophosphatase